jgi:hypothetical protein
MSCHRRSRGKSACDRACPNLASQISRSGPETAVVRGRSSEDAFVPAYLSAGRRPYGVSQDTRASELTGQQREAQLKLAMTYPRRTVLAAHRVRRLPCIGKQPGSRPIAGSAARSDIRARALRLMPSVRAPADHCAPIPHVASQIPDRKVCAGACPNA